MQIHRRGILGGLLVLPFSAGLLKAGTITPELPAAEPILAQSPPQVGYPLHPIFGYQRSSGAEAMFVFTLTTHYTPTESVSSISGASETYQRVNMRIEKHGVASQGSHRSLIEAENALLAQISAPHREVFEQGLDMDAPHIVRAANRISKITRRGAGNVMLIHRDDLPLVAGTGAYQPNFIPHTIGRWTHVGTFNSGIRIWVTDHAPPTLKRGYGLVGYRGHTEMDAGAYIAEFPGGRYQPFKPDRGASDGYFHTVGLTAEARRPYLIAA